MKSTSFRVLLVDDDEEDYLLIRDMLADLEGRTIGLDWVSSYEQARESIDKKNHDAYLVDYRLGARTGLDLIREAGPDAQIASPIILLTGFGDHDVDLKAMASGAADYLVKDQLSAPLLERSIRYAINRAQTMRELREGEERVRNLFDAAFEGIMVLDPDGKILDSNGTAARIMASSRTELIGTNIRDYCQDDAGSAILETASGQLPRTLKAICVRKDGKTVHLELSSKSYTYRGTNAILTACHDVSDKVNMEAQILMQDGLASIGLLASSLAHEIGTPLGVMRGRAEFILMQKDVDEALTKNVNVIIGQIDRVSKLIRSLLNLARGDRAATIRPIDARTVVEEVLELLSHELTRKQITAEILIPSGTTVMAEAAGLHQVILNLLVNAIHAIESAVKIGRTDEHQIKISSDQRGDQMSLSIQDSGCGISAVHLKQLFKPFFTTKDIGSGTGLGLATSYRILESWRGSIQVESQEGKGSLFTLLLPKA